MIHYRITKEEGLVRINRLILFCRANKSLAKKSITLEKLEGQIKEMRIYIQPREDEDKKIFITCERCFAKNSSSQSRCWNCGVEL